MKKKEKEFHWNYRLIKKTYVSNNTGTKYIRYDIHEVYYTDNKEMAISLEPILNGYETKKETTDMLKMMLKDCSKLEFVPPKSWKIKDVK